MTVKYANSNVWRKKALGSFFHVGSGVFLIIVSLYKYGYVGQVYACITILLIILAVFQMLYYLNMPLKDYLRFEGGYMTIYAGFLNPRKKLTYKKVDMVSTIAGGVYFHMEDGKEECLYLTYLSKEDQRTVIHALRKYIGEEKTQQLE